MSNATEETQRLVLAELAGGIAVTPAATTQLPAALGPTTPALSLSTVAAMSTTFATGQKACNGTAAALAATATYKNGIVITNTHATAILYYGNTGVLTSTGAAIMPSTSHVVPFADPAGIFLVTDGGMHHQLGASEPNCSTSVRATSVGAGSV